MGDSLSKEHIAIVLLVLLSSPPARRSSMVWRSSRIGCRDPRPLACAFMANGSTIIAARERRVSCQNATLRAGAPRTAPPCAEAKVPGHELRRNTLAQIALEAATYV
jgi:hypothetical protein